MVLRYSGVLVSRPIDFVGISTMDRVDLPKLYETGEFTDCTFVSLEGEEFPAHRFLFGQYPRLKELIAQDRRVQLREPTEVVERMLRWLYGVQWVTEDVQPTRMGIGKELMDIMGLCDAAEKVISTLNLHLSELSTLTDYL